MGAGQKGGNGAEKGTGKAMGRAMALRDPGVQAPDDSP